MVIRGTAVTSINITPALLAFSQMASQAGLDMAPSECHVEHCFVFRTLSCEICWQLSANKLDFGALFSSSLTTSTDSRLMENGT